MLSLRDFIVIVEDYEKNCRTYAENAFWEARAELGGNFLSRPFEQSAVEPIHRFLGLWRSYRRPINWTKLADVWTPEVQNVASSLGNVHLEFADDNALSKADNLYLHLWSANIEGMGHTNISKLLALSLTNLCVMWDKRVKQEFLLSSPRAPRIIKRLQMHSDYYRFLKHRRQVANELVDQVVKEKAMSTTEATDWLRKTPLRISSSGREKPLAKLLDEFYYGRPRK